jgi:hypothetical protein
VRKQGLEDPMLKSLTTITAALGLEILLLTTSFAASAAELPKPKGEVILTMAGAIAVMNNEGRAEFDMGLLKTLPVTTFKTTTTWTEGVNTFTGVSLKALLAVVGAQGTIAKAIALNDYAVEIPVSDAVVDGPIVAYAMNEQPMPVRDKGPLWIVYPYDTNADYRTEAIYSKSIWQLSQIELK